MAPFSKVLVANRGEIAIRIFRTLRELEIEPVAVYSEPDRDALHVQVAPEAYLLGAGAPSESYLNQDRILEAAQRAGAQAVHPGYGFLAENAGFARACAEAGLTWIGPPPEAIEAMGSKVAARETMRAAGVPIVPGTTEAVTSAADVVKLGDELGWPLAIKASAGGGGKGLKVVRSAEEAERAFEAARREGEAYFSDPAVYVERYLEDPRHVEVQVLADAHGNVIHLGERDCTIQRRHQKLVEETPSPAVDAALRERIGQIAVDAARAVGYRNAGTIEGLLDQEGNYYFLEMNTRIQVEHTVTELVTGLDLVREQVLIAAGEPLSLSQDQVHLQGHAIECRINAEDVSTGFLPTPGRITAYREPGGPGVRVDSGVTAGSEVVGLYDPLVAKLCVHGVDREHARHRMLRALGEYEIDGVTTLIGFHRALLEHDCFARWRDLPRRGRVGRACGAGAAVVSSGNKCKTLIGRSRRRAQPGANRPGRGRRAPVRGEAPHTGAAACGSGPAATRARHEPPAPWRGKGRDREPDAGNSARGRGVGRRRGGPRPGGLRRRGHEDGERGRGAAGRRRHRALGCRRRADHHRPGDLRGQAGGG